MNFLCVRIHACCSSSTFEKGEHLPRCSPHSSEPCIDRNFSDSSSSSVSFASANSSRVLKRDNQKARILSVRSLSSLSPPYPRLEAHNAIVGLGVMLMPKLIKKIKRAQCAMYAPIYMLLCLELDEDQSYRRSLSASFFEVVEVSTILLTNISNSVPRMIFRVSSYAMASPKLLINRHGPHKEAAPVLSVPEQKLAVCLWKMIEMYSDCFDTWIIPAEQHIVTE